MYCHTTTKNQNVLPKFTPQTGHWFGQDSGGIPTTNRHQTLLRKFQCIIFVSKTTPILLVNLFHSNTTTHLCFKQQQNFSEIVWAICDLFTTICPKHLDIDYHWHVVINSINVLCWPWVFQKDSTTGMFMRFLMNMMVMFKSIEINFLSLRILKL